MIPLMAHTEPRQEVLVMARPRIREGVVAAVAAVLAVVGMASLGAGVAGAATVSTSPTATSLLLTAQTNIMEWSASAQDTVYLKATVVNPAGNAVSAGTVTFDAGSATLCGDVSPTAGSATCTVPVDKLVTVDPTSTRYATWSASYSGGVSGGVTYAGSGASTTLAVEPTTTTSTTVAVYPSTVGWSSASSNTVELVARVGDTSALLGGGTPGGGTVTFDAGSTALCSAEPLTLSPGLGGTAAYCAVPVDQLAPADPASTTTVAVTATYSGGVDSVSSFGAGEFSGRTTWAASSGTASVTIAHSGTPTATTLILRASPTAIAWSGSGSAGFTAYLSGPPVDIFASPPVVGTVTFAAGSTSLCADVAPNYNQGGPYATCTVPVDKLVPANPASTTTVAVTATYSGGTSNGTTYAKTSGTTSLVVQPGGDTCSLSQPTASDGTQSATAGTAFGEALTIGGNCSGTVTWTAPAYPGATFANGSHITTSTLAADHTTTIPAPTAGSEPGTYRIFATMPGSGTYAIFHLTTVAAPLTVTATSGSGQSAQEGNWFTKPLTVTVTGAGGPVAGAFVNFSSPTSSPSARVPSATFATNAMGQVHIYVLAGLTAGSYTVGVSAYKVYANGQVGPNAQTSFSLSNIETQDYAKVSTQTDLSVSPVTSTAGVPETYTASVNGPLGAGSPAGTITVTATSATGSTTVLSVIDVTNTYAGGQFTAPAPVGTDKITATYAPQNAGYNGSSATMTVTVTPSTSTCTPIITATSGSGQSAPLGSSFSKPLVATITCAGKPVPDASVVFQAPSKPGGTFAGGRSVPGTANSKGVATSPTLTAGSTVGNYNVLAEAYVNGQPVGPAHFAMRNTAKAAPSPAPTPTPSPSPAPVAKPTPTKTTTATHKPKPAPVVVKLAGFVAEKVQPNSVYPHRLHATVTRDGQPVEGYSVTFRLSASSGLTFDGPPVLTATAVTDSQGVATSPPIRAGQVVGTFVAAATASGSSGSASATVGQLAVVQPPYGYRMVARDGGVFDFHVPFYGSAANIGPDSGNVVGLADAPDGYWLATSNGGVLPVGGAPHLGSLACHGCTPYHGRIVGIVSTPDGKGYWLVGANGGVYAFGDAGFYGSMGGRHLNAPVVGMAVTPGGHGYWLAAADGGVFTFGSARFYGSMGGKVLNKPIVGIAATQGGHGYWLVGADGGVFSFGSAAFHGSTGAIRLNQPVVGIVADPATGGYWLLASDGGVFAFHAPFYGSMGGTPLNRPVVGGVAVEG